ncbi:uncharacterized protein [Littorina saxatilis]|uniref:uncharacterized protein isoform X2 n=1 Tax=Littorina saxatilis TaxID=31220 RepID=UPI0038B552F7
MYCLAAFFIIGALGTTPSVLAFDCSDVNAWDSEMTKCFTQSGFSVDAHTLADVEIAMLTNTNYACRNTDAFKSAVSCAIGFVRNCLIKLSLWEDPAILLDANKVTDGLVYLCDHIADFDAECYIRELPTIEKCAEGKAHAALSVSSDRSLKFGVCTFFDAYKDCERQQLGVCPRRTKEIAVNVSVTYDTPAACSGGDFPRSTVGTSRVFLLFVALLTVICRY